VEQEIGQMVQSGPQTKELAVKHMRQPAQWTPVIWMKRGESPNRAFLGETRLHLRILINKEIVIEVYKVMAGQLMEYDESCQDQ